MLCYKRVTFLEGLIIIQDVVISFIEKLKNANRIYKLAIFAVLAAILIVASVFSSGVKLTYNIVYKGEVLANVSSKAVYDEAVKLALDKVSGEKTDISFAELKSVVSINGQTDSAKEVSELILKNDPTICKGYEIVAGGKTLGYISDVSVLEDAKNQKLAAFTVEGAKCESFFTEDITVKETYFSAESLSKAEDVSAAVSKLDVKTVAVTDKDYKVEYNTTVKKDSSKYAGYQSVVTKGENGVNKTITEVTYLNGVAIGDPVVTKKVVKAPVNEVIVVGTKNVYVTSAPQNASSSGFKWPLSKLGVLTSKFAEVRQNGTKSHGGVDIAVPVGTKVIAVKGGTVSFAGWDSGYGNYVVIDHGNGLKTLYAHNKSLCVSKGDTVTANQMIALSGNTGRSTGPHLHFEVRVNGKKVDPGYYIDLSKIS